MKESDLIAAISKLERDCYETADQHGWHHSTIGANTLVPEKMLMLHTEISEAVEEYRIHSTQYYTTFNEDAGTEKPEGVLVELADLMIRLLDLAGIVELEAHSNFDFAKIVLDKMAFNKKRTYRHGGRRL